LRPTRGEIRIRGETATRHEYFVPLGTLRYFGYLWMGTFHFSFRVFVQIIIINDSCNNRRRVRWDSNSSLLHRHPNSRKLGRPPLCSRPTPLPAALCFCPDFSAIARPMLDLLKKDTPFKWTDACSEAFRKIQTTIASPGRALKRFDPGRPGSSSTVISAQSA
jgi:hypothetical protein